MSRKLRQAGHLAFDSGLFAKALDALHEKMWAESYPETEDWMASSMLETITERLRGQKGIVRVTGPSPKNLQSRTLRRPVGATRPGQRPGVV